MRSQTLLYTIATLLLLSSLFLGCPKKNPPTADFLAAPLTGDAPLQVSFQDTSQEGSASITSWQWDFGDGGSSVEQHPTHTYENAGQYTVSLTVKTDHGEDTATKNNYIQLTTLPTPPTAAFSTSTTYGQPPLAIQFTDQSLPGSAAITSWQWDFGNGYTSTQQNPTHTYDEPGVYAVSLTITTDDGEDTFTLHDAALVAGIAPSSGQPGATVRIIGEDFSVDDPMDIDIRFDTTLLPPAEASTHVLTTSIPTLPEGMVPVEIDIDGSTVLTGLTFTILPLPTLEENARDRCRTSPKQCCLRCRQRRCATGKDRQNLRRQNSQGIVGRTGPHQHTGRGHGRTHR